MTHLDPGIVWNLVVLDQTTDELEVSVAGRWVRHLDLLDADLDQFPEERSLLLNGHWVCKRLVPIAQIGRQPDWDLAILLRRPLAIWEIKRGVSLVLLGRHRHGEAGKSGQTTTEAHATLRGTFSKDKHEILFSRFNINYNQLDARYRKGSVLVREEDERPERVNGQWRNGSIICPGCNGTVFIRDEVTGAFTVDMWEKHKMVCFGMRHPTSLHHPSLRSMPPAASNPLTHPGRNNQNPFVYNTPENLHSSSSSGHPHAHGHAGQGNEPPPKRRRAKRTEDERIEYLRNDPYVAQFEAYRYARFPGSVMG
ncbi:hypothetical protein NMY22_g20284 [Coprinellus aureogranulatus]|nr:hypothetical protein NMY22_g20284 [Coprinellus aureogranulatus]